MVSTLKRLALFVCTAMVCTSCDNFWVDPKLTQVTVIPATPSMVVGSTTQFSAVGLYEDGAKQVLQHPTWSSSNVTAVLVDSNGMAKAVSAGSATITAVSAAESGSTTATVVISPVTSLAVAPLNPSISKAAQPTQQFSATATFADGTVQDITNSVTWSSSNTAAATITNTGLATAIAAGVTTIKAVSGNINNSTTLTVLP
jgi:uncharacterized protein YjdB